MTLQAHLESIDSLPEELKAHYKPSEADNGGFVLDAEGVDDVSGLKSALVKERDLNSDAKSFFGKHKDYDFNQLAELESTYKNKLEAASGDSEKLNELKAAYDNEKLQLVDIHQKEKEGFESERTSLNATINKLMITDELTKELASIAVDTASLDLLKLAVENEFEVVADDGKRNVRVKQNEGGYQMTAGGSYKNIAGRVAEMANDPRFARLVKGSGNSGGGANNEEAGGSGGNKSNMSPKQKSDFITKNGGDKYAQLPE